MMKLTRRRLRNETPKVQGRVVSEVKENPQSQLVFEEEIDSSKQHSLSEDDESSFSDFSESKAADSESKCTTTFDQYEYKSHEEEHY